MCNKLLKLNWFMLLVFLMIGGSLSAYFLYELKWDFANYHFYNAWAFVKGRIAFDIAPAGIHTFFNPLLDLPLYFSIENFNNFPRLVSFIQGLWFGGLLFVFYKILQLFFDIEKNAGKLSVLGALIIGGSGFITFAQVGTSTNEIPIAMLVLWSFYLLIKEIYVEKSGRASVFLWAGLILGSAMGLKLTAVIYCLSTGLVLIFFCKSYTQPFKKICLFAVAGLAGFLLFNGWWMWMMWTHYQNPFMPFANEIFKSEYFADMNYRDVSHIPENIWQWLFFPFYWLSENEKSQVWHPFNDVRFVLIYFIFIISGYKLWRRKMTLNQETVFLTAFWIVSYIIWLVLFAIHRYLIVLDVLSAVFIVKAIAYCLPKSENMKIVYLSLVNILLFILVSVMAFSPRYGVRSGYEGLYPYIGLFLHKDAENYKKVVDMGEFNLPENTLILLYSSPVSGFVPLLDKNNNSRAVLMNQKTVWYEDKDAFENSKLYQERDEIIKNHKGPMVAVLARKLNNKYDVRADREPILQNMFCRDLRNNLFSGIVICASEDIADEFFRDNRKTR